MKAQQAGLSFENPSMHKPEASLPGAATSVVLKMGVLHVSALKTDPLFTVPAEPSITHLYKELFMSIGKVISNQVNSDRNIEVQWAKGKTKDRYLVPLKVYTEDRRGMLADISNAISTIDTNIVNATANTVESRFGLFELTVEVIDTIHLDRIINLIKEIKGVHQVDR